MQSQAIPNASLLLMMYDYFVTQQGGNSGSPVLHAQTGKAVGIHIVGGCTSSGGRSNIGQRIDAPDLVEHFTRLTLYCSRNSNCDDGNWCNGMFAIFVPLFCVLEIHEECLVFDHGYFVPDVGYWLVFPS